MKTYVCDSCGAVVTRDESNYCERHDLVLCKTADDDGISCADAHAREHGGRR